MTDLELSDAGRYTNIFLGDQMLASYDDKTGEFVVYDPDDESEDPAYVIRGDAQMEEDNE